MTKSAMVRARIEPRLKDEAEKVLADVGISSTEAIRLFYRQVTLHRGLPFEVRLAEFESRPIATKRSRVDRNGMDRLKGEIQAAIDALDAGKGKRLRTARQLALHLRRL